MPPRVVMTASPVGCIAEVPLVLSRDCLRVVCGGALCVRCCLDVLSCLLCCCLYKWPLERPMCPIFYTEFGIGFELVLLFLVKQVLFHVLLEPRVRVRVKLGDGVSAKSGELFPWKLLHPAPQTHTSHCVPSITILGMFFCRMGSFRRLVYTGCRLWFACTLWRSVVHALVVMPRTVPKRRDLVKSAV